jgi:hypothetical protein
MQKMKISKPIQNNPENKINKLRQTDLVIADWQIELGKKELQNIADGSTELIEWAEAKSKFDIHLQS